MTRLSIVIPCKHGRVPAITLESLRKQSWQDFVCVVQPDFNLRGANWARNEGFRSVQTEYVLFSDDDIEWEQEGLKTLIELLDSSPKATYSYGSYVTEYGGRSYVVGNHAFDAVALRRSNFVSTMSIIRSKDFPGFDESLKRLQDWDLWLTLLKQGKVGVYCGRQVFKTVTTPNGITSNSISWEDAVQPLKRKHGI